MSLKDLRENIDKIDFEIVKLIKQRMEYALRTVKFKSEIKDSNREQEVLNRVISQVPEIGFFEKKFVEKLFKEIIEESKRQQSKNYSFVGFQGEHGAYGEVAAGKYNPDLAYIPLKTFSDVFDNVSSGGIDFGIVPIENTLGGVITETNELLIETELKIIEEVNLPIHHCLLTLPDTDYRDLKVAYSHPQALAQCRNFLKRNNIEPVSYYDTAGAALMLGKERLKSTAVIASDLAAKLYGLEIIKDGIEDIEDNITRFLVLSKNPSQKEGKKCSIVFSVAHQAGALFKVLKLFADASLNLTRIESIPYRRASGNYMFMLDFLGNDNDDRVVKILDSVKSSSTTYKFLGCY